MIPVQGNGSNAGEVAEQGAIVLRHGGTQPLVIDLGGPARRPVSVAGCRKNSFADFTLSLVMRRGGKARR